jgi:hypothetical protein
MADEISQDDYLRLCDEYPLFKKVGYEGFGVKTWLVFKALNEGYVNADSVASKPCQSLMQHEIKLPQIKQYMDDLKESGMFRYKTGVGQFALTADNSYELHNICYKMGDKIVKSKTPMDSIIRECGYTWDIRNQDHARNFANGDVNAKADTMKDLLAQLAFAGAKFLIKCLEF